MFVLMKFVDRKEETAILTRAFAREEPSLYVIYGRRRLGKSTLINRLMREDDIYFMADRADQTQQRALLADTIAIHYPGFNNVVYPSWESLFLQLSMVASRCFVLCLDEFPNMVRSCQELPSVLQRLIDTKKLRYHVLICGSSQHMMQDIVLNSSEPLYGRARQILKFLPISIKYMCEALPMLSAEDAVDNYSVLGGVPRYWELREDEGSLLDMIMDMIANPVGMLYDETDRLLADDLDRTTLATSILSLIGNGVNRMAEIASRLSRKATDISNPMSKLMKLGYIEREMPFGENVRNSKKTLYKLNDPFLRFYYRFVVRLQSQILQARTSKGMHDYVQKYITDNFADFVAPQWEQLCREAVSGATLFDTTWNVASRWWGTLERGRQAEFDVVAESLDKKSLLIGECKWTAEENAEHLLQDLKTRSENFSYLKGHNVYYALFLRHKPIDGMQENVFLPQDIIKAE